MNDSPDDPSARLAGLAPDLARTLVKVAGDMALVLGLDGTILTQAQAEPPLPVGDDWAGRAWADTVAEGARAKVELLLDEALTHGVSQRRELSHPLPDGSPELPMSWAAVRLGAQGPVLAVGRDLRAVSAIQQRFLDAQQELEREYWLRRQAEQRYRQLFHVAQDAVLVVDSNGFTVLEANPAAAALLGVKQAEQLVGQTLRLSMEPASRPALDELLVTARATGRAAEVRLRLASGGPGIDLSATPFRAEGDPCMLLRARRAEASATDRQAVMDFIGQTPDAVVVTDSAGRVVWANPAFVELCEAPNEHRLRGRLLADALGGDALHWNTLLARVRARGIVGQASIALRLPGAPSLLASVSAAMLAEGDHEHIGFTLRPAPTEADTDAPGTAQELALDMGSLVERLGRLSLPELLAEAGRMAEVHLIHAALRGAGGRLDAAAETLRMPTPELLLRMHQLGLSPAAPGGHEGEPSWLN